MVSSLRIRPSMKFEIRDNVNKVMIVRPIFTVQRTLVVKDQAEHRVNRSRIDV